jgi:hypothetical protein
LRIWWRRAWGVIIRGFMILSSIGRRGFIDGVGEGYRWRKGWVFGIDGTSYFERNEDVDDHDVFLCCHVGDTSILTCSSCARVYVQYGHPRTTLRCWYAYTIRVKQKNSYTYHGDTSQGLKEFVFQVRYYPLLSSEMERGKGLTYH